MALQWLRQAGAEDDSSAAFLLQLAFWGLQEGVEIRRSSEPDHPGSNDIMLAIYWLLMRRLTALDGTEWLLSNPNLGRKEAMGNLLHQLEQARAPLEAAQAVLETAYDRMVAAG